MGSARGGEAGVRKGLSSALFACALLATGTAHSRSELSSRPGGETARTPGPLSEAPETYVVHAPDELAALPSGATVAALIDSLAGGAGVLEHDDARAVIASPCGAVIARVWGQELWVSPPFEGVFLLDFSEILVAPVLRVEITGRVAKLHLLDILANLDAVVTIPIDAPAAERSKVKIFGSEGERTALLRSQSAIIANTVDLAERELETAAPQTLEAAREAYSRMGALMVNHVREAAALLSPEQADALCGRAQPVITAVLLRLYVSDDGDAVTELDSMRIDPDLDRAALDEFAFREGLTSELAAIWPQCGCTE